MNEQDTNTPLTAPEMTTDTTGFEVSMRQTGVTKTIIARFDFNRQAHP
jgi:hypothetical protein